MEKSDTSKAILPLMGTTLAGLMAGASLFVSVVHVPGQAKNKPSDQLTAFRTKFPGAKKFFLTGVAAIVPTLCGAAYATDAPLLYLAAAPYSLMVPYTITVLSPTNDRLMTMTDEDAEKDEGSEIVALTTKWGKLHAVRTIAYFAGFAICLGSIAKKYMR